MNNYLTAAHQARMEELNRHNTKVNRNQWKFTKKKWLKWF